jgi:hypothetical protein
MYSSFCFCIASFFSSKETICFSTFSNASARSAAITSPVEGQLTYLLDDNRYDTYSGTDWLPLVSGVVWNNWAPVLGGGFSNGNGIWDVARYAQIGKTIHFTGEFTSGTTTTYGTTLSVSLPVAATSRGATTMIGIARRGGTRHPLFASNHTSSLVNFNAMNAAATYVSLTGISATIPFTWTTGDEIYISGTYEAA